MKYLLENESKAETIGRRFGRAVIVISIVYFLGHWIAALIR